MLQSTARDFKARFFPDQLSVSADDVMRIVQDLNELVGDSSPAKSAKSEATEVFRVCCGFELCPVTTTTTAID